MRLVVLLTLLPIAASGSLGNEFSEVVKGLERVWTLGIVGPRLEHDLLINSFGTRSKSVGCVLRDDVVLVECREPQVDLSDAERLSGNAIGAMACADGLIYIITETEARRGPAWLAGLVAGLEAALRTGRKCPRIVLLAISGETVDRDLAQAVQSAATAAWETRIAKPRFWSSASPKILAVRAQDVDTVILAKERIAAVLEDAAGRDAVLGRTVDLAQILHQAKPTSKRTSKSTQRVLAKKQILETTAGAKCALATTQIIDTSIDTAIEHLIRRIDDKFCENYDEECSLAIGDVLDSFDDQLNTEIFETEAYTRARAELADSIKTKIDDTFLDQQLQLLAQSTAQHLRTGLKNLRISQSMTKQTNALLADADTFFAEKAAKAFGTSRPWKAKQRDVNIALSDYVTERLQLARLQGTFIPDQSDTPLLTKLWPFPINFAFHWLVPSALGLREQQSRGLTPKDRAYFNIVDGRESRFPIPSAISSFTKNLVAPGSANAPVE
mmetsp:Transcript_19162/g.24862  ORF Transcript_19162/g.24862 Transcript_19162/m.24862 type:complete len:499 (-) Transcript_19162:210-1706(-)